MTNQQMENMIKLAAITVTIGVNLQKDQPLIINAPVESASFAHLLADCGYKKGAKDVMIQYADERLARLRYDHASIETLSAVPAWQIEKHHWLLEQGAAMINIYAEDPDLLTGADTAKIQAASGAMAKATDFYHRAIIQNDFRWCVISVPTPGWARKVFPQKSPQEAIDALWSAIFTATRTDAADPLGAWREHDAHFDAHSDFLNACQFDRLIYHTPQGTQLEVGMPQNHVWTGGSEAAADGITFFPNIPTEEIFCAPHKDKVNGTLEATHPLVYRGQLIDGFGFTFKDGRVTDYHADTGYDALKALVHSAPGADQLGEIALVPQDSPIANLDLLFYNTLFDENASCHFALGSAYPSCIAGGNALTPEEQAAAGLNDSTTHVDFMVGSDDLTITGIKKDGSEVPVFIGGNWAPRLHS
jgi:aminopeptidase